MNQKYVLDTNFFINRQRPINLGKNKEEVIINFIKITLPLVKKNQLVFLTTPESHQELASFFKEDGNETFNQLTKVITISSYNRNNIQVTALLFEELIAETGKRLYRGLRISEEIVKNLNQKNLTPEVLGFKVAELRDKYRRATREGFIDSTIDLGLIFLAKEAEATLVSSDQGLLLWARKFGCQELLPEQLVQRLRA